jgi:hypothetical protein
MYDQQTSDQSIDEAMNSGPCCKKDHFHSYGRAPMLEFITKVRARFWDADPETQNQDIAGMGTQRGPEKHQKNVEYKLFGLSFCCKAVCKVLGISLKRWYRYTDQQNATRGKRKKRIYQSPKRNTMLGWMESYFSLRGAGGGDWMPDVTEAHLNHIAKFSIYQEFRGNMLVEYEFYEEQIPVYSYFVQIMEASFPHVKIGGYKEFAKCDHCSALDLKMANTRNRVKMKIYLKRRADHKVVYMAEKRKYWKHISKAILNPDKYLITIGDGMEQKKSTCPWWVEPPYQFQHCANQGVAVQGIINHAHSPKTLAYVVTDAIKKGGNFTVEWLLRNLIEVLLCCCNIYIMCY